MAGYNLPPGCSVNDIPGNGPTPPCEVCGGDPDNDGDTDGGCICPQCPNCGEYGNPRCYMANECGLKATPAQELQLAYFEKLWTLGDERGAVDEHTLMLAHPGVYAPDNTPPEVKAAVAEAEQCLHTISRAFAAGIKPTHSAARLTELAQTIQQITDQWPTPKA